MWLRQHNPLFKDIKLDDDNLNALPEGDIPDAVWQTVVSSTDGRADEKQSSSYVSQPASDGKDSEAGAAEVPLSSAGVVDVDADSVSMVERAETVAADFRRRYLRIPHDPDPVNTIRNPKFWLLGFCWLFPWGIGAPDDPDRPFAVSLELWVRRALELDDARFQHDRAFMFVAANLIQRYHVCLQTKLVMHTPAFRRSAEVLRQVTASKVRFPC